MGKTTYNRGTFPPVSGPFIPSQLFVLLWWGHVDSSVEEQHIWRKKIIFFAFHFPSCLSVSLCVHCIAHLTEVS